MQMTFRLFVVVVLATVLCSLPAEGKHIQHRSLSAREVYSILREAGREDVIPEGRFITHGIESDTEPQLGHESEPKPELDLTETGRLLVSADALNATTTLLDYMRHLNYTALLTAFIPTYNFTITKPTLNFTAFTSATPTFNLTALNLTALTALKPGLNLTTLTLGLITTRSAPKTVQKEICFSSRSLNDIYDDEIETESEDDVGKSTNTNTGTMPISETGYETASSPTGRSKASSISSPDFTSTPDSPTLSSGSGIGSGSATGPATYARPYNRQRLGSATINCVVVRRPQNVRPSQNVRKPQNVRRRQSTQNVRRPQSNRGPQNVHRPQIVQRPQNIRKPQNVQRPQTIRRPQNGQRPKNYRRTQNIGRSQSVKKSLNTRRPHNIGRGWFASN